MLSSQKEKEEQAFKAFLKVNSSLNSQIENWDVQSTAGIYPDIICQRQDGQDLGFELGEWINEKQISQSNETERFQFDFLQAIGTQPENTTEHIHLALLSKRNGPLRFDSNDTEKLEQELFRLIKETDQQWPNEHHWQSPQGYHCRDFAKFPTLGKYLQKIWFPLKRTCFSSLGRGIPWIQFMWHREDPILERRQGKLFKILSQGRQVTMELHLISQ
ncbi:MAG: hypothetical protein NPIRA04_12060 [Nitrospirales bacterium]|nr:MAG: hypothetical protein NPIRA04_12060 [Nitrospirales bacterium]